MIKRNNKKLRQFLFITILIAFIFFLGMMAGRTRTYRLSIPGDSGVENFDIDADFSLFWDTWEIVRDKYKDVDSVNDQNMVYGATDGLIDALGDPYSEFFRPVDGKRFLDDISGSFEGIGAEIGIKDGVLTIIAPLEGTPAKKAGLESGDSVMQIDGEMTMDLSIEGAVQMIRGKRGTKVVLTVIKSDGQKEDISITRGVIKVPAITLEVLPETDIAYIRMFSFTQDLSKDFNDIAQTTLRSSAKKIILDMRDNPGGYLEVAVDIAGWFLEDGDTAVIERRGKSDNQEYKASGPSIFKDWPIVVLINKGSASASEILAGALRDNLGSVVVGETSFGKGSVQEMVSIGDGAYVKLTVADWLTPEGVSISEAGIEPDIIVEMGDRELEDGEDLFLQAAIEAFDD